RVLIGTNAQENGKQSCKPNGPYYATACGPPLYGTSVLHLPHADSRLENEKKEREQTELKRHEKLVRLTAESINANMTEQMQKIIHKELEVLVVPALGKLLVQTIESSLLKPLQENLKTM